MYEQAKRRLCITTQTPESVEIEGHTKLWQEVIWDLSYNHSAYENAFELRRLSIVFACLEYARQIVQDF